MVGETDLHRDAGSTMCGRKCEKIQTTNIPGNLTALLDELQKGKNNHLKKHEATVKEIKIEEKNENIFKFRYAFSVRVWQFWQITVCEKEI